MGAVLDAMQASAWSVRDAAAAIGTSTAQLVRFLQADAKLWTEVNARRRAVGLRDLV